MPYICYEDKRFNASSEAIIEQANAICKDYMTQGYTLTLRQLYYQFVARGHVENTEQSYKRIGSIINDARMAGRIDWDAIEDRTRNLEQQSTWKSPREILDASARQFKFDYWAKQPVRVEVWVEKEALVGVIERIAFRHRCPYFACRGYTSQSEAWRAGRRFLEYNANGQGVRVIHLGDHDPSGIDMTRDNDDRLSIFAQDIEGEHDYDGLDVEIERVALNMDQVRRYNPPPNPAKLTDARAQGYIKKFGDQSWELDALDPKVIDDLITRAISKHIEPDAWNEEMKREERARKRIAEMAKNWSDDS